MVAFIAVVCIILVKKAGMKRNRFSRTVHNMERIMSTFTVEHRNTKGKSDKIQKISNAAENFDQWQNTHSDVEHFIVHVICDCRETQKQQKKTSNVQRFCKRVGVFVGFFFSQCDLPLVFAFRLLPLYLGTSYAFFVFSPVFSSFLCSTILNCAWHIIFRIHSSWKLIDVCNTNYKWCWCTINSLFQL